MAPAHDDSVHRTALTPEEIERQLALLRHPPPPLDLSRPATIGDGIRQLHDDECENLVELSRNAAAAGRLGAFIPASGAASRMFSALQRLLEEAETPNLSELEARARAGDALASQATAFFSALPRSALAPALRESLATYDQDLEALLDHGRLKPILSALLEPDRLDLENRPKALIPFHCVSGEPRTALAEQLAEGARYLTDNNRECRLHFSVPVGWEAAFEREIVSSQKLLVDATLKVELSVQEPSTGTIALDSDGSAARREDGSLIVRPGGHGALLGNLEGSPTDLVLIKNIDNVLPASGRDPVVGWHRRLLGLLLQTLEQCAVLRERIERAALEPEEIQTGFHFAASALGARPSSAVRDSPPMALQEWLLQRLSRPLRVCGMVRNAGEHGGGPFWVRDEDGSESLQIVESAQLDRGDAKQLATWNASTHFNPVQLAVCLADCNGQRHELFDFRDPSTAIVTEKRVQGRPLRVLERPGLWNGAMAGWNTLLVEVPAATFAPVKSIFDVLRPAHQN